MTVQPRYAPPGVAWRSAYWRPSVPVAYSEIVSSPAASAANPPAMLPPRPALLLNDPPGTDCHLARTVPVVVRSKSDITPLPFSAATGVPVRPPLTVSLVGLLNEPPALAWTQVYSCPLVPVAYTATVPFWVMIAAGLPVMPPGRLALLLNDPPAADCQMAFTDPLVVRA